ncbi:MAG: nucleotidyltransferase domain-containing protein [Melioribacteraceae bacterium]|nr:nucleotidyltransferase domain-containing protein [Melioribacteraceae bacterium]MCF8355876.1 nucleotidyltransferase domain-containing protein [Melioribacteraceae bacterium]MCF8393282.1 nucleotidyltransferase domain-containing protein [Melioribacteraceae bacterium]MCF8419134.1 nucleotidyltransferase domain-containing protein [Melioribacteraceae bacterium]
MKTLDKIKLSPNQYDAVTELKRRAAAAFDIVEIVIFGSVARGEADHESDLDILIVTKHPLKRTVRHQITDIVCEINLHHDTNLSTLVVDQKAWKSGLYSVLPIHQEILTEGVSL